MEKLPLLKTLLLVLQAFSSKDKMNALSLEVLQEYFEIKNIMRLTYFL